MGPLLFNLFINDLFYLKERDICNYADDNTLYVCVIRDFHGKGRSSSRKAISWFGYNG